MKSSLQVEDLLLTLIQVDGWERKAIVQRNTIRQMVNKKDQVVDATQQIQVLACPCFDNKGAVTCF